MNLLSSDPTEIVSRGIIRFVTYIDFKSITLIIYLLVPALLASL